MASIKTTMRDSNVVEVELLSNKQILPMLKKVKSLSKEGYTIMISFNSSVMDFQRDIGTTCARKSPFIGKLLSTPFSSDDRYPYEVIGMMMLSSYIPDTFFLLSKADNMVYEIRPAEGGDDNA